MTDATDYMADTARLFGRQLADNIADFVNSKVGQALALERDRYNAELSDLHDDLTALANSVTQLQAALSELESRNSGYSIKVPDQPDTAPAFQARPCGAPNEHYTGLTCKLPAPHHGRHYAEGVTW